MNTIDFFNELMEEDHESVIVAHYGNEKFKHIIPTHPSTWNHNTFLNITQAIQKHYKSEIFSLYERVGDEQLIIDDIDDIIAIFDNDESDNENQDQKNKNNKIAHIYIKDNDTMERENWKVNSFCMIYSRSKSEWFEGKIIKIYGELEDEWLVVKYNNKSTKEIQRNSKDLKPVSNKNILSLRIGSKCLILSEYSHLWYEGQVISILNDDEGEWLAIKYKENDLDKIADIQRYSKQLKLHSDKNYTKYIVNQHTKKEQKQQEPDTMIARIKALKRMNNEDRDKEIKRLLNILSNILKNPLEFKYRSINMTKLKQKFTKYPICIELLYDAGFKKVSNGKKLTFSTNNMKLLKKTDKALKKEFPEIAEMLTAEENARQAKMSAAIVKEKQDNFSPLIQGSFEHRLFGNTNIGISVINVNGTNENGQWQTVSLFG